MPGRRNALMLDTRRSMLSSVSRGEEQPGLVPGDEALQTTPAPRGLGGPDPHLGLHVRIEIIVVGMVVVAGLLVHPPAVTPPDRHVRRDPPGNIAGLLRAEHL